MGNAPSGSAAPAVIDSSSEWDAPVPVRPFSPEAASQAAAPPSPPPTVHTADQSDKDAKVIRIATTDDLRIFLFDNDGRLKVGNPQIVGIEFAFLQRSRGHDEPPTAAQLGAIVIAGPSPQDPALVLLVKEIGKRLLAREFERLLADNKTFKVMHDVRQLAATWRGHYDDVLDGVDPDKWMDLELLFAHGSRRPGCVVSARKTGTVTMEKHISLGADCKFTLQLGKLSVEDRVGRNIFDPDVQDKLVHNAHQLAEIFLAYRFHDFAAETVPMSKNEWSKYVASTTALTVASWKGVTTVKPSDNATTIVDSNVAPTEQTELDLPKQDRIAPASAKIFFADVVPPTPITVLDQNVNCIATNKALLAYLSAHNGKLMAGTPSIVGIEFSFAEKCRGKGVQAFAGTATPKLGAIAIAGCMPQVATLVLLVQDLDKSLVKKKLQQLLNDQHSIKVLHDVEMFAMACNQHFGDLLDELVVNKLMDLELLNSQIQGQARATFSELNQGTDEMEKQISFGTRIVGSLQLGCLSLVCSSGTVSLLPKIQDMLVNNAKLLAKMFWTYRSLDPKKVQGTLNQSQWESLVARVATMTVSRWKIAVGTRVISSRTNEPSIGQAGSLIEPPLDDSLHLDTMPLPPPSSPNDQKVICISTTEELHSYLNTNSGKIRVGNGAILGIEFIVANRCSKHRVEPYSGLTQPTVVSIAIAGPVKDEPALLLRVELIERGLLLKLLRDLLADKNVTKVMLNVDQVGHAWRSQRDSLVANLDAVNWMDMELLIEQTSGVMQGCIKINTNDNRKLIAIGKTKTYLKVWPLRDHLCGCQNFEPMILRLQVFKAHLIAKVYFAFRTPGEGAGTGEKMSSTQWKKVIKTTTKMTATRWGIAESSFIANSAPATVDLVAQDARQHNPTTSDIASPAPPTSSNDSESKRHVLSIGSTDELRRFLEENGGRVVVGYPQIIGIDFTLIDQCPVHGSSQEAPCIAAISIASADRREPAVIIQAQEVDCELLNQALQSLMDSEEIVKVVHCIHRPAAAWHSQIGNLFEDLMPSKFIDLQLLYEHGEDAGQRNITVLKLAAQFNDPVGGEGVDLSQGTISFKMILSNEPSRLSCQRDVLTDPHLQQMAHNAESLAALYTKLRSSPASGSVPHDSEWDHNVDVVTELTVARWENAIANNGIPAIWFDLSQDYMPRSLECLVENGKEFVTDRLELLCDIDPLLKLLPRKYRDAITAIDDYHHRLVDVCLDVGRVPYAYIGKRQRVPLVTTGHQGSGEIEDRVSKVELVEILGLMGGEDRIGSDNRAGIDRQLHRISVMRSKTNEVYGITMRVGRTLQNAASVLTDLLLAEKHREKSVLLLGHPGSGKTTLIRDVARFISATQENVCIVDTSNEIGGDGLVPHECVGWARRMMVPTLEAQASVMIECVQNHTVETMIIDEIGRKSEVMAAATVRQRGPRLVASAHGDFRSLLKNPDLRGLVGGVQQVTVGDAEAKQSGLRGKLRTERAGNPIFDVIVELDRTAQGLCHIIWDVGEAVDCVLASKLPYRVETRKWNMNTRGVQVLS